MFHSYEEAQALREAVDHYRPIYGTVVEGTICKVHKELPPAGKAWSHEYTQLVAAWAPPLNALCLRNYPRGMFKDAVGYTPDHTFSPREPQADDGTGPSPVKQAYARCQGCFDRGWHREETDVSAIAFGMDPSTLPEYPTPGPPASKEDMVACLIDPKAPPRPKPPRWDGTPFPYRPPAQSDA